MKNLKQVFYMLLPYLDKQLYFDRGYCVLTTNLTHDEISTQYGSRVYDRMKEMFNVIAFDNAKSRRK